jgi:hypothetical protein
MLGVTLPIGSRAVLERQELKVHSATGRSDNHPPVGGGEGPGDPGMAVIRATCHECGDVEMTTADVWVRICDDDNSGTYSFTCPCCTNVVNKPAEPHVVDLLIASGVTWSTWRMPLEVRERSTQGAPISHDDLLDFHDLLESDDWFAKLADDVWTDRDK